MDAVPRRRRREYIASLRATRPWDMSESLGELIEELIRPVSHYGQSFDRDDSGLLERYLSAAGIRALDAREEGRVEPLPNYAELGLVLQSVAHNFGWKVDHLYNLTHDLQVRLRGDLDAVEGDPDTTGSSPSGSAPRRRRDASPAPAGFSSIQLSASEGARRRDPPSGPPPTLPRVNEELQPRAFRAERALDDYAGESIGTLDDFHVSWRLVNGYLVEELESGAESESATLRPLSLMELQEACARASEPAPPARSPHTPPPCSPEPSPPPPPSPARMPPPAALRRKRRSEVRLEDLLAGAGGTVKMHITMELVSRLQEEREFCVPSRWIRRVVRHRADEILEARRNAEPPPLEFRGFDMAWTDIGGFLGWAAGESCAARAAARLAAARLDSDDDGFFERSSSLADSTRLSVDQPNLSTSGAEALDAFDLEAWQARVLRRATASAPLDVRALARDVSRALPPPPAAISWPALAGATARAQPQRSRVFLDILMRATRGQVEIIQGEPLTIDSFSVRAVEPSAEPDACAWMPRPDPPDPLPAPHAPPAPRAPPAPHAPSAPHDPWRRRS